VSFERTMLLGVIAGLTIFLGLPLARVRRVSPRARAAAALASAGILAFLLVDVLGSAFETVERALESAHEDGGSWARFGEYVGMLALGLSAGLVSLGALEGRWLRRPPPMAGGAEALPLSRTRPMTRAAAAAPLRLAMLIAAAIGLHNFSEGLAIGVSAKAGAVSLATMLVVGFALHNATEGFGIIGPLDGVRPTWGWLALAGLVGGGPTILGTALGFQVGSPALALAFLALAAGAILYVVLELWSSSRRRLAPVLATSALAVGFLLAYGTELVIEYAGA
jgi:zinc transporter, ZIP family